MTSPFEPILAQVPGISLNALRHRVESFSGKRLLVLGDLMLDEYVWGEVHRVSPEAPVPVVESRRQSFGLGGAANVVNNVRALGGQVIVAGLVGQDASGIILTQELEKVGADVSGLLTDPNRPTTSKLRVVAHSQQNSQQIVRIDRESREKIGDALAAALLDRVAGALDHVDAVLISDYNKGIWVPALAEPLMTLCRRKDRPVVVNLKPANAACVKDSTLVTVNQFEAMATAQRVPVSMWEMPPPHELDSPESMETVGRKLRQFLDCDHLFVTQGGRGLSVFGRSESHHLPAIPAEVYDGTGAGDTVVSVTAMTLASGGSALEAAALGNAGGAIKVHKLGAVSVSVEELLTLILEGRVEVKGAT
ncbi:MAG: D-glycero-beta-D-manno-heptose-7-phosphate kinase [Armatimonadetes bacterium]|nr:D-glycero-beta-D-manno-heptose-7-phosphate kinase [Armatimonadota bacterium]